MSRRVAAAALLLASACTTAPVPARGITHADLQPLAGAGWRGTLTYRDYSPPFADVTLAVEAQVAATAEGLSLALHYPREPRADGPKLLALAPDGATFDGEPVIARETTPAGLVITTEAACEDDNRPAICRHDYTFAARYLGWRKTVRFADGQAFRRNEYVFTR